MPDLTGPARRLVRRLLAVRPAAGEVDPGLPAVADGTAAVATVETALDAAAVSLAEATGRALAGLRATTLGSAAAVPAHLAQAAAWGAPLVVHLTTRADHRPYHALSGTGALQLFAANVQEAADFALVARRVAEEALLPAVVAMDLETALGVEDLRLPSPGLLARFLGDASDSVHPPTPGQEMLFGRHRRRVPRRHDPERPLRTGGPLGPEAFAPAAAARRAFIDPHLPVLLDAALAAFSGETGRRPGTVSAHRVKGARLILVAQGVAVETAEATADHLAARGLKVGVVGIRALRPFPAAAVIELLGGCRGVAVLERVDAPLGEAPPLLAEVRGALERARENDRAGRAVHPGLPALSERRLPRLASALYGLGGSPLRAADLAELCLRMSTTLEKPARGAEESWPSPVYLGLDLSPAATAYPKRQAILDALRRSHPEASRLGMRATGPTPETLTGRGVSVAIHRRGGHGGEGLADAAAHLLHGAAAGHLRVRRDRSGVDEAGDLGGGWGELRLDRLLWDREPVRDPGDGVAADLALWHPAAPPAAADLPGLLAGVRNGGALVLEAAPAGTAAKAGDASTALWETLPAGLRQAAGARRLTLYAVPGLPSRPTDAAPADLASDVSDTAGGVPAQLRDERLLGALIGALLAAGKLAVTPRRLRQARRENLDHGRDRGGGGGVETVERRLAELQAGFDQVRPLDAARLPAVPARAAAAADRGGGGGDEVGVPAAVRRGARSDDALDSLPRFWDRVGVLYRHRQTADLAPDPYLAVGAVPALTAALRDRSAARTMLPAFDPARCTGCGACWIACPDAAVTPIVLSAAALLEHAMARARERGGSADALRMVAGKLAAGVNAELAATEDAAATATAGPLFDAAFERLMAKTPLAAERKAAVRTAFAAARQEIVTLPVARTDPFFAAPEAERAGSGELFVLAINPDACKGCGLCVAECAPGALSMVTDSAVSSREARALWRLADELPPPLAATVEQVRSHPEVGPLAAALLADEGRRVMVGGHAAEAGSGEAIALRRLLGAAAYHLRPRRLQLEGELADLEAKLGAAIHDAMAGALPAADLAALARGLDSLDRPDTDLAELASRIETSFDSGRVDVVRLRRLVAAARALADLRWRLERGEGGCGRAPFALAFGPGPAACWAGAFPDNPFAVPVTVDATGDAPALARGLLEGQLAAAAAGLADLRRARLELERPAEAEHGAAALARLGWRDLTADERQLCPPLLLVLSEESIGTEGVGGVLALLAGELPVKVVVLAGGPAGGSAADLAALAASRPGAMVVQTTIAHPEHLAAGVAAALDADGPALVRILAPSPRRRGFAPDRTLDRVREAVAAGAFALLPAPESLGATTMPDQDATQPPAATADSDQTVQPQPTTVSIADIGAERQAATAAASDHQLRVEIARHVRARLLALVSRPPRPPADGVGEAPP